MDHHHDNMKLEYSEACRQNVYRKQWTYFAISISICSQLLPFELNTQCRPHTISFDSVIASTDCLQKVETNWGKRQQNLGVGCLVNTNLGQTLPCLTVSPPAKHTLETLVQFSSF